MKYVIRRTSKHALQYYVAMPGGRSDWALHIDNATVYSAGDPLPRLSFGQTFDYRIVPVNVREEESIVLDTCGDRWILIRECYNGSWKDYLNTNRCWEPLKFLTTAGVKPILFGLNSNGSIDMKLFGPYLYPGYTYTFECVSQRSSRTVEPIE